MSRKVTLLILAELISTNFIDFERSGANISWSIFILVFVFFVCFLFVCLTIFFFWFSTRIIETAFLTFSFRFFFYPACSTLPPLLSRWLLSWWFSSTIHEKSWVNMLVYFLYRIGNICSKSSIKTKCWTYSEYTIKTWEQRQLTPLNAFIVNFSIWCITLLLFVLLLWTRS